MGLPRKTVEELPVGLRAALLAELLGHLITVERFQTFFLLCFLTHRDPTIGVSWRRSE